MDNFCSLKSFIGRRGSRGQTSESSAAPVPPARPPRPDKPKSAVKEQGDASTSLPALTSLRTRIRTNSQVSRAKYGTIPRLAQLVDIVVENERIERKGVICQDDAREFSLAEKYNGSDETNIYNLLKQKGGEERGLTDEGKDEVKRRWEGEGRGGGREVPDVEEESRNSFASYD